MTWAEFKKKWARYRGEPAVESPIFAHPQFERLEAEGEARGHTTRLRKALEAEGLP